MACSCELKKEGEAGRKRKQQLRWIFNQSTLRFLTATAGSVRKLWRTLISMPASFTLSSRSSRVCVMKGRDGVRQTASSRYGWDKGWISGGAQQNRTDGKEKKGRELKRPKKKKKNLASHIKKMTKTRRREECESKLINLRYRTKPSAAVSTAAPLNDVWLHQYLSQAKVQQLASKKTLQERAWGWNALADKHAEAERGTLDRTIVCTEFTRI